MATEISRGKNLVVVSPLAGGKKSYGQNFSNVLRS